MGNPQFYERPDHNRHHERNLDLHARVGVWADCARVSCDAGEFRRDSDAGADGMDGTAAGVALHPDRVSVGLDAGRGAAFRRGFAILVRAGEGDPAGPAASESFVLRRVAGASAAGCGRARRPGDVVEGGTRARAERECMAAVVSQGNFAGDRGSRCCGLSERVDVRRSAIGLWQRGMRVGDSSRAESGAFQSLCKEGRVSAGHWAAGGSGKAGQFADAAEADGPGLHRGRGDS